MLQIDEMFEAGGREENEVDITRIVAAGHYKRQHLGVSENGGA